ncbi:hypothetical protein EV147_3885 [Cupriavidus agavae]|uniref:DUF6161 domain-containing protein n=2 Tax=Cupriavidus agavae TaxID=1001822 RepID=A0A4Q7RPB7_9BURK|nr:hypothetical protein EV147_3885 [Cupriavidus agavae]
MEAVAYLYTRMHGANNYQFDARDISSWRGFLAGVLEQIPTDGIPARAYQAALESMSDTRVSAERLLAEKTEAYSALHRNYESVSADVSTIGANQEALFEGFMETNQKAQDDALAAHQGRMKTLEDTFREKMALRAPVEYWEGRQEKHEKGTKVMGGLSFGAMALLAIAIGLVASWVLHNLTPDGKPEVWRVSVLVLIGVLGVWATIVDLAGVRIALYFPAERLEVDKIIRERFTVAEVKPFEGSEKPPFKKPIFRVLGDQSFAVTRDFSN